MATIINSPMGVTEASLMSKAVVPMSSAQLSKRKELKEMLIKRLGAEHGSDPMRTAVITREVESSALLRSGKLTGDGLKALEASVAAAVRATRCSTKIETLKPPPTYAPDWSGHELYEKVKASSNWEAVAAHRASYYNVEQQRKTVDYAQRKEKLRVELSHQMALEGHRRNAEREMVAEEKRQVTLQLTQYEKEVAAAAEKRKLKMVAERQSRDAQMREQAARAAATKRLEQLENEELLEHMKREAEVEQEKKAAKQRANEEYHKTTATENIKAKARREEARQLEWAEDSKLNAQWKAMLDKQEADRTGQYTRLREKIKAMQRVYENSAGADLDRRLKEEEATRDKWTREHEQQLDEQLVAKKEKRKQMTESTTAYIKRQAAERKRLEDEEKEADRRYAESVMRDVTEGEAKDERKKSLKMVALKEQHHHLNEQVREKRDQAARDPGASEMTALEATLNRSLLVSMVQHQYNNVHPLN